MKKGWDRYAIEARYIKKGYLRKYRNGNPVWKAPEASSSDCIQPSKEKEEVENHLSGFSGQVEEQIICVEDEKGTYVTDEIIRDDLTKRSSGDGKVIESVMVMQDIPEKQNGCRRKARSVNKCDQESPKNRERKTRSIKKTKN